MDINFESQIDTLVEDLNDDLVALTINEKEYAEACQYVADWFQTAADAARGR